MKKIKLIALSDICPASGIGRGADIDQDICFDEYGLPYIPARRIKGCLREAADFCVNAESDKWKGKQEKLFGTVDEQGLMHISSARVPQYEDMIRCIQTAADDERVLLTREAILSEYTTIRRQTAIEAGAAKERSLRSMRVLKRGLTLEIDVEYPDDCEDAVKQFLKAWRFIGAGTTRGLGRIKAELESGGPANEHEPQSPTNRAGKESDGNWSECELISGMEYSLKYLLYLEQPVLIGRSNMERTEDYIPGVVMRGCLSSEYMKKNFPEEELAERFDYAAVPEFCDLFLKGHVRYLPARVSDSDMNAFEPAPASLMRARDDAKSLFDFSVEDMRDAQSKEDNEKKKSMEGRYIRRISKEQVQVRQVALRMDYHHAIQGETRGSLFRYQAIEAGQYFRGEIIADGKYMKQIVELMKGLSHLRIGRSRTAEYGLARISRGVVEPWEVQTIQGREFIAVLNAPVCLMDECGAPAQGSGLLLDAIMRKGKGTGAPELINCFLKRCRISGYNVQWRLAKPTVHAYDIGTVLAFRTGGEYTFSRTLEIGGMRNGGCGAVRMMLRSEQPFEMEAAEIQGESYAKPPAQCAAYAELIDKLKERRSLSKVINYAIEHKIAGEPINSTTCAKLLFMLTELECLGDYEKNIEGIMDEGKRLGAQRVLFGGGEDDVRKALKACGAPAEDWKLARAYIRQRLTMYKYALRKEGLE